MHKPARKAVRAKQQEVARLQYLASFEKYPDGVAPFESFTESPPLLDGGKALTPSPIADDLRSLLEKCKKDMEKASQLMPLWKKYGPNSVPTIQRQNILLWLIEELSAFQKEVARSLTEIARLFAVAAANPCGTDGPVVDEEVIQDLLEVTRLWKNQRTPLEEVMQDLLEGVKGWEDQRDAFLAALEAGNQDPFFETLKALGGSIIYEARVSLVIQKKERSALFEEKDRAFLRRLKKELNFLGSGPPPQLDLIGQRGKKLSAGSLSKAVSRLKKKHEGWRHFFGDVEAVRQTKEDFKENSKLSPDQQEKIIESFLKQVNVKG